MHWFKDVAWNDVVLAAVACISPLGVWLPFWFDHRQKSRDRRQRQLGELERLRIRLRDTIEPWANEWRDDSYNHEWYRPDWHVLPFEWGHVESFNRLVLAGDYPAELTAMLVRLEEAARRFHAALAQHDQFRSRVPGIVTQNLQPVYAAARTRTTALSDSEISAVASGLDSLGRQWIRDLFESNRRIHVESIGHRGTVDGLYVTFRAVVDAIERVGRDLRATRDPWWYVSGHAFAGILAVTGFLFLGDFWWSFLEDRRPRRPAVATSAVVDSTATSAAQADTPSAPVKVTPRSSADASHAARDTSDTTRARR